MTTIAFRGGKMAADSCLSEGKGKSNTLYVGSTDKIYRLDNGSLLGLSGDAEATQLVEALNQFGPTRDALDALTRVNCESRGILVRPDGKMWWITTNNGDEDDEDPCGYAELMEFRDDFAAIGSGGWIAYGAMEGHTSVTAGQAVWAACHRHPYTRPPVHVFGLDGKDELDMPDTRQ